MDSLPKQLRVKFSGLAKSQKDAYNTPEGRIPPQKTATSNREREKVKSRYQQQYSYRINEEDFDLELGAAIAAAAYAIMLAEEEHFNKKPVNELGSSLTKFKSRREDSMNWSTDNSKNSRWFSAKPEDVDDGRVAGNSTKRKSSTLRERMQEEIAADLKMKDEAMNSTPSIKKTPTFPDKYPNDTSKKPFDHRQDMKTKQSYIPTNTSMPSFSTNGFHSGDRIHSTNRLTKAYDWEQVKMEKLRKRHQKMNNTILQWENEKKVKARRRKERKERELEMKRMRILQEFREEITRIDMIASGARAVAEDVRRNDELKAKEKAKKMRSTAKVQHKCFCF